MFSITFEQIRYCTNKQSYYLPVFTCFMALVNNNNNLLFLLGYLLLTKNALSLVKKTTVTFPVKKRAQFP